MLLGLFSSTLPVQTSSLYFTLSYTWKNTAGSVMLKVKTIYTTTATRSEATKTTKRVTFQYQVKKFEHKLQ